MRYLTARFQNSMMNVSSLLSQAIRYHKVASSNTFHLEEHAGFFRLLMKGILDAYIL